MKYDKETFERVMKGVGWQKLNSFNLPYGTSDYMTGKYYICNGFIGHFNNY